MKVSLFVKIVLRLFKAKNRPNLFSRKLVRERKIELDLFELFQTSVSSLRSVPAAILKKVSEPFVPFLIKKKTEFWKKVKFYAQIVESKVSTTLLWVFRRTNFSIVIKISEF